MLLGFILASYFERIHIRDTVKVIIMLSLSFILITIEDNIKFSITFSALIAIMFIGISLQKHRITVAKRLSIKFNKLWVCAEIILFALVGATVDIHYIFEAGTSVLILVFGSLCFRMLGVFLSLLGKQFSLKEIFFCMIAYTPKATVQAAIGGVPLAMGLSCGNIVLTVAVITNLNYSTSWSICYGYDL